MKSLQRRGAAIRRGGVTLTELVVAIAIVAVLASLTFFFVSVGHRAAENVTNKVAAVNPKAARSTRPNSPMRPVTYVPNQYLVQFDGSVTNPQAEANRIARVVQGTVLHVYPSINGAAFLIPPGQLSQLQAAAGGAQIVRDQVRSTGTVTPTGISRVRYANAPTTPPFKISFPPLPKYFSPPSGSSGGIVNLPNPPMPGATTTPIIKAVAVIDSGIEPAHPELFVVYSTSFGKGIPTSGDDFGHGTHCAGIIGARGKKIVGMFPGVPLWSIRVFPPSPPGVEPGATDSDIIAAVDFVTQNANQVSAVNMSLGGPGIDPLLNAAVTACVKAGVVVCVAAGNDAKPAAGYCPASAPGAICVAAMCDTDGLPGGFGDPAAQTLDPDDTFASFSNYDKTCAVCAPGEEILSTLPLAQGSYGVKYGTSMATPHVTGLSALLLSNTSVITHSSAGSGGGLINVGGTAGSTTKTSGPLVTSPSQVLAWMLSESVETGKTGIAGLAANKDKLVYPMITGRP